MTKIPQESPADLIDSATRLQRTEAAVRKILAGDAATSGPGILDYMTRELSVAVAADFILIGEMVRRDCDSIRTLSYFGEGRHRDQFEYDLLHTPCEQVIGQAATCYPANVADLFPRDVGLRRMGIEGYIGIPLFDSRGTALGILVALYRQPLTDPDFAMSILQLFASRISGEMERDRNEARLRQRAEFERLIADLSTRFIQVGHDDLDREIDRALAVMGEFASADRAYIFRFIGRQVLADLTHEWCREGTEPQIGNLQGISYAGHLSWFGDRICSRENVSIPRVDQLPPEAKRFRAHLESQDILSLICVPLVAGDRLVGFLGFDFVREAHEWPADHTPLLRIIGEIITNAQERKRRDLQLRESSLRMELALEGAGLGMYDWNIRTGELAHDQRWGAMLDYRPDDVPRTLEAWERLVHPDDLPRVQELLAAHLNGRSAAYESEHRLRSASGKWIWVLDKGKIVERDADGKPVRMTGTHMNITPRKEAEEAARNLEAQVRHAQKMESLGVLAGGIAHDFNNLLMAILGNADLALGQLSPIAPARECLKEIEAASRRAADLCNQMLAYSGKSQSLIARMDLSELVREMAHMLEVTISKKAKLEYRFADDIPPIEGDSTQIGQVVMNLITNASESLEGGRGTITLSTGSMECDEAFLRENYTDDPVPAGEYAYLEVTDTGSGMDQEVLSRVFDPFFTTKFTGRGLGLSAVLGIVRNHRGILKVRSAEGRGTTFLVLFPAVQAAEAAVETPGREPVATTGSGTILVVDDERAVRDVARKMLDLLGFDVILAENGQEGLDMFTAHRSRLRAVLLDRTMPDLDGDQVLEKIREIDPDIPVVQISGYGNLEPGNGETFIQKPFTLTDLRKTFAELLPR